MLSTAAHRRRIFAEIPAPETDGDQEADHARLLHQRPPGFAEGRAGGVLRGSGRVGIVYGTQNSDHFRSSDDVDAFYRLGQRVSQLTYNWQNHIGAGPLEDDDPGLSLFDVEIVEAIRRMAATWEPLASEQPG